MQSGGYVALEMDTDWEDSRDDGVLGAQFMQSGGYVAWEMDTDWEDSDEEDAARFRELWTDDDSDDLDGDPRSVDYSWHSAYHHTRDRSPRLNHVMHVTTFDRGSNPALPMRKSSPFLFPFFSPFLNFYLSCSPLLYSFNPER